MTQPPRRILVTGVSRGLGRALAVRFAALGHTVVGCARDAARLAELSAELGAPHRFDPLDVTDDAAVGGWAERVVAEVGVPELLVNNAGVINRRRPLWEIPAAEVERLMAVNVLGVVNVLRHFLPPMIAAGRGVVVNVSSGWGKMTAPGVAPYCASKFAIEGLTGALAQELPPGLAAIPVQPGIIHTEMLDVAFGEGAAGHWTPDRWVDEAAPFLLALGPEDNGKSLRVPGS